MSQSHDLQLHISKLREINSILTAMKNLALIEAHKLARYQPLQSQRVNAIEQVAADFLHFYPQDISDEGQAQSVCIMVGTERGFCGDFNEKIIDAGKVQASSKRIALGSRLAGKLTDTALASITTLTGANVAEEVPIIVNRLIECIAPINHQEADIDVLAIYYDNVSGQIRRRQLLPFCPPHREADNTVDLTMMSPTQPLAERSRSQKPRNLSASTTLSQRLKPTVLRETKAPHGMPPLLYLKPAVFFSNLLGHYLFAVLHEILYVSLAAENHRRLQHLEGAVNHLDDEITHLQRKSQTYRQEEITEEIEVILLNAENSAI